MNTYDMKADMAWVKDNYGISVQSALERKLRKVSCNSRAKLFEILCEILGTQSFDGVKQAAELNEIHYNS
jgi:hypothetical protein